MVSRLPPLLFSKLVCKGQNRSFSKINNKLNKQMSSFVIRLQSTTVYTACKGGGCTPTPFSLFSTLSLGTLWVISSLGMYSTPAFCLFQCIAQIRGRYGGIGSLESILGLVKSLKIRAQAYRAENQSRDLPSGKKACQPLIYTIHLQLNFATPLTPKHAKPLLL
jgi:hypothetical protein